MGRPRKFVESDVITSAGEVFTANGYAATTLDDLVKATGLGKQSIYNAFGGKRELFLRALSENAAEAAGAVTEALGRGDSSPLEKIRAQMLKLAIVFSSRTARTSLSTRTMVELGRQDGPVAKSSREALARLATTYERCIIEGQTTGEIDPEANSRTLAMYFVTVTHGMEVLGSAGVGRAELTAVALASLEALPTLTGAPSLCH
jgi:TetR/AcrR family transcriptional repressor of nem operon